MKKYHICYDTRSRDRQAVDVEACDLTSAIDKAYVKREDVAVVKLVLENGVIVVG